MEALLQLSDTLRPDLVVLSGDITQRATKSQFAAARRFVRSLQRPVLAIPGNHDIPLFNIFARVFNPYGAYRQAMGPVLEPVVEQEGLLVIGLNSTSAYRHERGKINWGQIDRVAKKLRQAGPDVLRVVVLHHPVRMPATNNHHDLLIGRDAAVTAWVEAGADLILGGHIHLPYVLPALVHADTALEGDVNLGRAGGLASPERQAWIVQAGTAVSSRVRREAPNSVNLIEHIVASGQHQCDVQRWDYRLPNQGFEKVQTHKLEWCRGPV